MVTRQRDDECSRTSSRGSEQVGYYYYSLYEYLSVFATRADGIAIRVGRGKTRMSFGSRAAGDETSRIEPRRGEGGGQGQRGSNNADNKMDLSGRLGARELI